MSPFPPRLHGLLARDVQLGLILRRGPSKSVCTLLWNRKDDTFTLGQWLKGRIYERRCDLSPDGRHFLYFAMNGHWESESRGSWTAISKAPYLKALVFMPKGDCWNGGGLFLSDTRYWINGCGYENCRNSSTLKQDELYRPPENFGGECPGVYYHRLLRDGWVLLNDDNPRQAHAAFDKEIGHGLCLRKYCFAEPPGPGHGCYYDRHALVKKDGSILQDFPDWEWAELDKHRLVWTEAGKLKAGHLRSSGLRDIHELHDFSSMIFEERIAPY